MLNALGFALNMAWKILAIVGGWMLFKYVLKNGSGTMRDILDTISVAFKALGHAIRKWCIGYLKREASGDEQSTEKVKVDATVE